MNKISSGNAHLDTFLDGGYEEDILTTIYGPAGSGKTILCMLAAANAKKKVIYIDSEGGFSVERLMQMRPDFKEVLGNILFLNPLNFDEQKRVFERLKKLVTDQIGLIVFDSVAMLYKLEIGKTKDVFTANKELGLQVSFLAEIARKRKIPVMITNHVYSDHEDGSIHIVGGDVLKYASKSLLELQVDPEKAGVRKLIIRKHRSSPEGKVFLFRITGEGVEEVK
ncbi:MAG: DNA repair and recombination protein RadB [Nanoarchaeota archaeon]